MITEVDIKKIDSSKLYQIYENWPKHFERASKISLQHDHDPEFYDSIILSGMGGSATSSDILNDMILLNGGIPSFVARGHHLPAIVNKHSLVIINSVSGNTIETVQAAKTAHDRGAELVCISSGGKLKEFAMKYGHKHIDIPNLSVPRVSLPYLLMPGLNLINPLLEKSLSHEISDIIRNLSKIKDEISATVPEESNVAKKMANFLNAGFAFCLSSPHLVSVGVRFKNSLNENAKVHCIKESILEASHNEIVPFSFSYNSNPKVIFLRWLNDDPIVKERFNKVGSFFQKIGQPFLEIIASQKSLLNAIICSIYIMDYSTVYMAVERNIDPSPTPAIDILKKM